MLAEPDLSAFGIDGTRVAAGHVEFAPAECQLLVHGVRTPMTVREFEVLEVLVRCAGHVVIRTRLKEVSPDWRYIHTHFGVGYRFEPEPVSAAG